MRKDEAKITPKIYRWFLQEIGTSAAVEVKHTRGKFTFTMSELKEHQIDYLTAATTERGFAYKLPDYGGYNPFDVMMYKNADAFVIIVYPDDVVAIRIQKIATWAVRQKSLTLEQALKMAAYKIKLLKIKY